jgi:FkbM family methyltransferase
MFYNNALVEKKNRVKIKMLSLGKMTIKINKKDKNFKSHVDLAKSNLHKNYDANPFFSKAIRLQDILVESNAPKHIDFFSLDVEGSELNVLKGIDHSFYKFKFILIEIREFKKVNKFLNKKNYKLIDSFGGRDFLYKFNSFSLKK